MVANQTLGGDRLAAAVKGRVAAGECSFYVVVPATPPGEQLAPVSVAGTTRTPSTSEFAHALATQRLATALSDIRGAGGQADGEVGDPDPLEAVRAALRHHPADELLVSTLPARVSTWLRRDLPSQVQRATGLPVTHIVGGVPAAR